MKKKIGASLEHEVVDNAAWSNRGAEACTLRYFAPRGETRLQDLQRSNGVPSAIAVARDIELRQIKRNDAPTLHALIEENKQNLLPRLHWPRYINSLEDSERFCMACEGDLQTKAVYGIWLQDGLAGVVSFNVLDLQSESGDIGYWLDASARGKGIATVAVQAMVQGFAERRLLRRYVIKCAVANRESQRVAERLGFSCEGVLKFAEKIGEVRHDQYLYALSLGGDDDGCKQAPPGV